MEREFGPIRRPVYGVSNRPAADDVAIRTPRQKYIIVDGYNVIFAWRTWRRRPRMIWTPPAASCVTGFPVTRALPSAVWWWYSMATSRRATPGEKSQFHNIQVVYTKEGQTADAYIEALAHEIGRDYAVRVASSDGLVQLSSFEAAYCGCPRGSFTRKWKRQGRRCGSTTGSKVYKFW